MGAIDGKDIGFIAALIAAEKPKTFVEIGCASGLSTAMIAKLLEQNGEATISSFDLMNHFYADPSKPVGYLLQEIPEHPSVMVSLHTGCTSLDIADHVAGKIDMCFIDAAHEHPWPLLDTLAVLPLMRPGGIIIHHDLMMYPSEGLYATGPKILIDQLRKEDVIRHWSIAAVAGVRGMKSRSIDGNIYAIRVPQDYRLLGYKICQGFYLGWDRLRSKRVSDQMAERFNTLFARAYGPEVARSFNLGRARYNPAEILPPKPLTLLQRLANRLAR